MCFLSAFTRELFSVLVFTATSSTAHEPFAHLFELALVCLGNGPGPSR